MISDSLHSTPTPPSSFLTASLRHEAHVIGNFISHTILMKGGGRDNYTGCHKLLIYCLMNRIKVSLPQIIYQQMTTVNKRHSLCCYGRIITLLFSDEGLDLRNVAGLAIAPEDTAFDKRTPQRMKITLPEPSTTSSVPMSTTTSVSDSPAVVSHSIPTTSSHLLSMPASSLPAPPDSPIFTRRAGKEILENPSHARSDSPGVRDDPLLADEPVVLPSGLHTSPPSPFPLHSTSPTTSPAASVPSTSDKFNLKLNRIEKRVLRLSKDQAAMAKSQSEFRNEVQVSLAGMNDMLKNALHILATHIAGLRNDIHRLPGYQPPPPRPPTPRPLSPGQRHSSPIPPIAPLPRFSPSPSTTLSTPTFSDRPPITTRMSSTPSSHQSAGTSGDQ